MRAVWAILVAALLPITAAAGSEPVPMKVVSVHDGDTLHVLDDAKREHAI